MTQPAPTGRQVTQSAIWYTASTFLTKSLGFLTIPLFTRLMTREEFGTFNAFAAIQILVIALLGLESFLTLNRARFDFDSTELPSYQLSILTLSTILSGVALSALLLFPSLFEALTSVERQYLLIMAIYIMFYPSFNMFQSFQRVQYKFKLSATISFAVSLTATALSVVLVVSLADALMGRIAGYYLPFAAVGLGFYIYYWFAGQRVRLAHWKYAIPLCLPLMISTLGAHGLSVSSRIVVQHVESPEATAIVALASTMTNIAIIFVTALNHAWSPWLMDCLARNEHHRASRSFLPFLGLVTVLCVAGSLFAPEAVAILGGPAYADAVPLVPSFLGIALLGMIANQYIFIQTYYKAVGVGGVVTLIVAIFNVGLLVISVQTIGYGTAGYAALLSYIVLILAHKLSLRRLRMPDLFPWSLIGIPIGGVFAIIPVSLLLFDAAAWIRYVLVGALLCASIPLMLRVARRRTRK